MYCDNFYKLGAGFHSNQSTPGDFTDDPPDWRYTNELMPAHALITTATLQVSQ